MYYACDCNRVITTINPGNLCGLGPLVPSHLSSLGPLVARHQCTLRPLVPQHVSALLPPLPRAEEEWLLQAVEPLLEQDAISLQILQVSSGVCF